MQDLTVVRGAGTYPGLPQSGGTPAPGPPGSSPMMMPPGGAPSSPQPPGGGGPENLDQFAGLVVKFSFAKAAEEKQGGNQQAADLWAQAAQAFQQAMQAAGMEGGEVGPAPQQPQGPPQAPAPSESAPYQGSASYGSTYGM